MTASSPPSVFHQVVVEGPSALVRGYIAGWLVGTNHAVGDVLIAEDLNVACEGFVEQCAAWLRFHQPRIHFLVPDQLVNSFRQALTAVAQQFHLNILSDQPVKSASFRFSYAAYNTRAAAEIHSLLTSNPGRVWLSDDYQPVELADPGAVGAEAYTAAHAFEVTGKGEAKGDLWAILDLHARCRETPMVDVQPICLELAG